MEKIAPKILSVLQNKLQKIDTDITQLGENIYNDFIKAYSNGDIDQKCKLILLRDAYKYDVELLSLIDEVKIKSYLLDVIEMLVTKLTTCKYQETSTSISFNRMHTLKIESNAKRLEFFKGLLFAYYTNNGGK